MQVSTEEEYFRVKTLDGMLIVQSQSVSFGDGLILVQNPCSRKLGFGVKSRSVSS